MTTKLRLYMSQMLKNSATPYAGFLGAYNMGLFGLSESGKPPMQQGLLASGTTLRRVPQFTSETIDNPRAANFVKYYDTPSLWGFGDQYLGMERGLYNSILEACRSLGYSMEDGLDENQTARVGNYVYRRYRIKWNGVLGKSWAELATKRRVQARMNQVGAWTHLVNRWRAVIAQSRYLVDITSLSPPFSGHEAQVAICEGIRECLENWLETATRSPDEAPFLMIRLMFGMTIANAYGMGLNTAWNAFYAELENTLKPLSARIARSGAARLPVILYGSDMGKKPAAFNHSKIVAGDGQYAVVGGHNMCEEPSSNRAPVIHDITCEVTGPGAKSANAFAGSLWMKAAESGRLYIYQFNWTKNKLEDLSSASAKLWAPDNYWYYELGKQEEVEGVLPNQYWYYPMNTLPVRARVAPPEGSVPATAIMGIGRWGDTKVFSVDCAAGLKLGAEIPTQHACHYTSDTLKRLMIRDRKNTVIGMAQQDLINAGFFGGLQPSEHTICQELGRRLRATPNGVAIRVVVSARFTQNCEGLAYSYGDGPREAVERISDSIVGAAQASSDEEFLPERLEVLGLDYEVEDAPIYAINQPSDASFCTVAPLAFCQARGTTRERGSYVWPDARFVMERKYTNGRFWNEEDDADLSFGPGNHSKVLYVSEGNNDGTGLVLIGSDNMYPSPLSEFSFVIEGTEAIQLFRRQYWDRLWAYSARLGFTVMADGTVV